MFTINLVCHDDTKLQNLNLKGFILNFLGVVKVFGNKVILLATDDVTKVQESAGLKTLTTLNKVYHDIHMLSPTL